MTLTTVSASGCGGQALTLIDSVLTRGRRKLKKEESGGRNDVNFDSLMEYFFPASILENM